MDHNTKKIVRIGGFSVFFILIIIYAIWGSKDLIFGVKIKNVNLNGLPAQSSATIADNIVKITGNAKNAIDLTLNGRKISIDEQGNFNETIALLSGYNIINIKAEDKFNYIDEKNYKLMYLMK
ncbi:MAG: hypothetical protein PHT16_00135 [Candidatus Pacebacteria bacterium]|nr:hypothetical protein [Candidatus Paceibacterota bacterium]